MISVLGHMRRHDGRISVTGFLAGLRPALMLGGNDEQPLDSFVFLADPTRVWNLPLQWSAHQREVVLLTNRSDLDASPDGSMLNVRVDCELGGSCENLAILHSPDDSMHLRLADWTPWETARFNASLYRCRCPLALQRTCSSSGALDLPGQS